MTLRVVGLFAALMFIDLLVSGGAIRLWSSQHETLNSFNPGELETRNGTLDKKAGYDEGMDAYPVAKINEEAMSLFKDDSTRCPFYDSGERFSCDLEMNEHDPAMKTVSDHRMLNLRQHLAKSKSTLWFIGDSISRQYFDLFSCAMFYAGSHSNDVEAPMHTSADGCREFDDQFQLCYISAGTAIEQDHSVKNTISALNSRNVFTPGSIIIANEGNWWRGVSRGIDEKDRVKDFNVKDVENNRRIKVFWRETLAQHFPSRDGTFASKDSWYDNEHTSCVPVEDSTKLTQLNQEINDILDRNGVSIIPGFDLSLSASSAHDHLEQKTPHCKRQGCDCTHWCTPSNTLNQLRDTALESINNWIETKNW